MARGHGGADRDPGEKSGTARQRLCLRYVLWRRESRDEDPDYVGGEHADTGRNSVEDLFYQTFKLDNIEILTGLFPEDTGHKVENLKFRLCHIDVDVYQSAKDVAEWIWERLVPGGMIVYDDYGGDTTPGIARYVDAQLALEDRIVLHNLNGHAIVIKR
jgi:O-methyltransferase